MPLHEQTIPTDTTDYRLISQVMKAQLLLIALEVTGRPLRIWFLFTRARYWELRAHWSISLARITGKGCDKARV